MKTKYEPDEEAKAKGWNDLTYQQKMDLWDLASEAELTDLKMAIDYRLILADLCEDVDDLFSASHHRTQADYLRRRLTNNKGVVRYGKATQDNDR